MAKLDREILGFCFYCLVWPIVTAARHADDARDRVERAVNRPCRRAEYRAELERQRAIRERRGAA